MQWNGVVGTGSTVTAVQPVNDTFTVNNPGGVSASITGTTLTYSVSLSGAVSYGLQFAVPDTRAGAPGHAQVLGPAQQRTSAPTGSYTAFVSVRYTAPGAPLAQVLGSPQQRTSAPSEDYSATCARLVSGCRSVTCIHAGRSAAAHNDSERRLRRCCDHFVYAGVRSGRVRSAKSEYRPVDPPLAAPTVTVNQITGGADAFTASLNLTGAVTYQKRSVNAGGDALLPAADVTVAEAVRYQAQVVVRYQRVTPGTGAVTTVSTVEHSAGLQYRLTYHLDYAIDYPSAASLVHVTNTSRRCGLGPARHRLSFPGSGGEYLTVRRRA